MRLGHNSFTLSLGSDPTLPQELKDPLMNNQDSLKPLDKLTLDPSLTHKS